MYSAVHTHTHIWKSENTESLQWQIKDDESKRRKKKGEKYSCGEYEREMGYETRCFSILS